jgi:hypothetical protein
MNLENTHLRFSCPRIQINAILVLGLMIILALVSFELFNFTTTEYALTDLIGDFAFLGVRWATLLSIAFCGMDFAGISRLFMTGKDAEEPKEVWYLFEAWLLTASINAILTWWGISIAILSHPVKSTSLIEASTMVKVVPVFVAIVIWVIRVLIIGTISTAGANLLKGEKRSSTHNRRMSSPALSGASPVARPMNTAGAAMRSNQSRIPQPMPRQAMNRSLSTSGSDENNSSRTEPTYHRTF